jgi:hypothetical protein
VFGWRECGGDGGGTVENTEAEVACMPDYVSVDKTSWFIEKMRTGWFSRTGIVDLAASEFPDVSRKTLDGTIGQYWSDSVNPKWSTYKAIQLRGLTVVDRAGQRRLAERNGTSYIPGSREPGTQNPSTRYIPPRAIRGVEEGIGKTRELWNSNDAQAWHAALDRYWIFVKPANLSLEREMDRLDVEVVRAMDAERWYEFLLEKYFRWKYTAPNRYASTTKLLRCYAENNQLSALHAIKNGLFSMDKNRIQQCLTVASSIRGLGTAGASGLLAILFPEQFGTVDQFAVKALGEVPELPEAAQIAAMNPEFLKLNDGEALIRMMRQKAADLNRVFSTTEWTPRKVDMVLWTCAR